MSKIIHPNDYEIEFRMARLPDGSYGITCTICEAGNAENHTWRVPSLGAALILQREHRRLHFGERADT